MSDIPLFSHANIDNLHGLNANSGIEAQAITLYWQIEMSLNGYCLILGDISTRSIFFLRDISDIQYYIIFMCKRRFGICIYC